MTEPPATPPSDPPTSTHPGAGPRRLKLATWNLALPVSDARRAAMRLHTDREPLKTADEQRTAAARVTPESGAPFIVYGSVLPWVGSPWREHPSAGGAAFRAALARYYGSRANRDALEDALEGAGLAALTAGAGDPVRRDSAPAACIDHVCARRDSAWQAAPAVRWPDVAVPPRWLSDHFGVSVAFTGPT